MEQAGFGTERIEAEVLTAVPGARVARLDRDATRRRGAAAGLLDRFGRGDIDVLIGTQMIAKGHDFPRVTLVGVVSADIGLGLADFRAAERTFQLLTQVVGRAGRGDRPGEAIIQTLYPEHYGIRLACRQDYTAFFEEELRYRRAMRYPPVVALVNGIVRGRTLDEALTAAGDLAGRLRRTRGRSERCVRGGRAGTRTDGQAARRAPRPVLPQGGQRRVMREALRAALDDPPRPSPPRDHRRRSAERRCDVAAVGIGLDAEPRRSTPAVSAPSRSSGWIGAGVKQRTKITSASTASQRRRASSGSCSSIVGG